MSAVRAALALVLVPLLTAGTVSATDSAAPSALPSSSAILSKTSLAADYYRPMIPLAPQPSLNGWSWATFAQGENALFAESGDPAYLADGMTWGGLTSWKVSTSGLDPDDLKAGQVYHSLNESDPRASLTSMDARMAQGLATLPLDQYDWSDALFMGLPNWASWSERTGDTAYLAKMDALYEWSRDEGALSDRCAGAAKPQSGLFDAAEGLWYRDCRYVGTTDAGGNKIFWGRGNGWAIAAMADVVTALPAGDARAVPYRDMLRTMAARLVELQGSDGFWRSSLLNSSLFPAPETSATALIAYALASGISSGTLDRATYLPSVSRAWDGLASVSLQPSGFVTGCQAVGFQPAKSYTAAAPRTAPTASSAGTLIADSPPFCVGAFLLAGSAIAALSSPGTPTPTPTATPTPTRTPTATPTATPTRTPTASATPTVTPTPTVPDTVKPKVVLLTPTANARVSGTITFVATAADASGIYSMNFYLGSSVLGRGVPGPDDTYTYAFDSSAYADGAYQVTAKAKDPARNTGVSRTYSITIDNSGPVTTPTATPRPTATPTPTRTPTPTATPTPTRTPTPTATPRPSTSPTPAAVGAGRYQDGSPAVTLSGTWTSVAAKSDDGGGSTYSSNATASATLTFTGTSVEWISRLSPSGGINEVYLDGVRVARIDRYSSSTRYAQTVWSSGVLPAGVHTVSLRGTADRNPAARGKTLLLDALVVRG
ncbi:hypothetical protein GRS96_00940 [Rathayibacter sp. VKM Ac-2803]|uniref:glycoside hydrolase family 88 protein n=1 Tax=unclassified Rathayibacter TaxID=2609250 RepID=UPI00135C069D|nr:MULTISPECIES: glycoside hydrolase family 88 protein [unclassified Rathayibacter]MWV47837.1 hypothetical protein [Rathayibacter sp. VKM Ac-2803]MWV58952.1 hypothetical protein [Rathayibacter sp. VKM Ac-2754]